MKALTEACRLSHFGRAERRVSRHHRQPQPLEEHRNLAQDLTRGRLLRGWMSRRQTSGACREMKARRISLAQALKLMNLL